MKVKDTWQLYALGSAFFAALTVLFSKLGVAEIKSDLATFIRTLVILVVNYFGFFNNPFGIIGKL